MIFLKTNILLILALALVAHGLQVEGLDILRNTGGASGVNPVGEGNDANGVAGSKISRHLQNSAVPSGYPTPVPSGSPSTSAPSFQSFEAPSPNPTSSTSTTPSPFEAPTPDPTSATSTTPSPFEAPSPDPTSSTSTTPSPFEAPSPDPTYFTSTTPSPFDTSSPAPTDPTPTMYPTTIYPTFAETDVSGPWDINFIDLSADFSVNSNFLVNSKFLLVLNYVIGKGRQFDTFLFMKDCITNVTDIAINYLLPLVGPFSFAGGFPEARAFPGVTTIETLNNIFDTLTLGYDIDKSMIANSSIWNATSSQIELCQVVQLKEGTLVITEDKRQVSIDFDLSVDYEVNAIALGAETINAGNDTVDASSYIEACKCDGVSFVCNTDDLVPNLPLIVCIKSVSPDLEIDFLESMNITQGDQDMAVVSNQAIVFTSFTSVEYVSAENGVVVSTRVPTNVFDYNTVGSVIGITGGLVMKLPGSGRNLKTDIGAKLDANEEASFEIEVTLQRELGFVEETSSNSAANVASSKGVIGSVMLLACAYAMW